MSRQSRNRFPPRWRSPLTTRAADGSVSPEVAVEDDESPERRGWGDRRLSSGRPAEAQEGGGPLWLSSITSDQEEKDAE